MAKRKSNKKVKKTNKPGRPEILLFAEEIIFSIDEMKVNPSIANLCDIYGISGNTLRRFIKKNPLIQEAIDLKWDKLQDISREVWEDILLSGDTKSKLDLSKWIMSRTTTKYKDKQDITLDGEITLNIKGLEDIDI